MKSDDVSDCKMMCAYCGKQKKHPDDFPVSYYAKCKDCFKDKPIQPSGEEEKQNDAKS